MREALTELGQDGTVASVRFRPVEPVRLEWSPSSPAMPLRAYCIRASDRRASVSSSNPWTGCRSPADLLRDERSKDPVEPL